MMDAKEVIVSQAVANAELMASRDDTRAQLLAALQENQRLTGEIEQYKARDEQCKASEPHE